MIFTRKIRETERLPWGYGLAYWRINTREGVCYLIPFNLLVRWARGLYFWISNPKTNYREMSGFLREELNERHRILADLRMDVIKLKQNAETAYHVRLDLLQDMKVLRERCDRRKQKLDRQGKIIDELRAKVRADV